MNNYKLMNKKHIVITGSRGSGKTTLLRKLSYEIGDGVVLPGLMTWCEREKAVFMSKVGSDETVVVGRFNPDSPPGTNRMHPVQDGFDIYGVDILSQLISDSSEWVTIDEIGYLENTCSKYLEKLCEVFDRKRVIAVVRKQETDYIRALLSRKDVKVIDLDYSQESI